MKAPHRGRSWYPSNRNQRGLAIVEFAITMPLVLFMLIVTAEVGRALYQYTALTKAVRDGARYLANQSEGGSTGLLSLNATQLAAARNVTVFGTANGTGAAAVLPGFTTTAVTAAQVGTSNYVSVSATYQFQSVFSPIPTFGLGDPIAITTFSASAVQRSLR